MLSALSLAELQPGTRSITRFSVDADTEKKAAGVFKTALERLSNADNWNIFCENADPGYLHTDGHTDPVHKPLKQGDYLCASTISAEESLKTEQNHIHVEKIETHLNPCAEWEAVAITIKYVSDAGESSTEFPEIFTTVLLQRENRTVKVEIYENTDTLTVNSPEQVKQVRDRASVKASSYKWEQLAKLMLSQ